MTKRLLSVILAFVFAVVLFIPALATEEPEPPINWDEFTIVTQPPEWLELPFGADIVLSVEVSAPEGVTVTYQWQIGDRATPASEQPQLRLSPGSPHYPVASAPNQVTWATYRAIITATVEDEDGNAIETRTLQSRTVSVRIERERGPNIWEMLVNGFGVFMFFVGIPMLGMLLYLPLWPFIAAEALWRIIMNRFFW